MARLWATLKQRADSQDVPYPKHNPLSGSGAKVLKSMEKQYGKKKGKSVFYATKNKNKMSKWDK